jgi:hypothetical protein
VRPSTEEALVFFDFSLLRPRLLALLAATALSISLAACGDDDDEGGEGEAQTLRITVADKGKGQSTLEAPTSAEPGPVEITLENRGKRLHDAQLFRVAGGQTAAQTIGALGRALQAGAPLPDWLTYAGGVQATEAGASQTVTQALEPGTYYIGDIEGTSGPPEPSTVPKIVVSGEAADSELPESESTVRAFEYGFEAQGLTAGRNQVLFENAGAEPHHLEAFPLLAGRTIEDVKAFVKTEKGKPPVDFEQETVTTILEGGTSQLVTLDLEPGRYALLCFVSDRQGGPPHAVKGMVSEGEVE